MVDRALIDTLNFKSRDFAERWKDLVRTHADLKYFNTLEDKKLMEMNESCYPLLARTLDRGVDRSLVGGFFVKEGKERMREGFPMTEEILAWSLAQKIVMEYLLTDFVLDSTIRMYQGMGIVTKVTDFFLLGSFYITKGFLEETYTHMNNKDRISEELLKKYIRDDLFFRED